MLGIDLSPAASRLVSIASAEGRAAASDTRVESFAILPPSGPDRAAALAAHSGQDAAIVVWGASSDHRQIVVRRRSYRAMRAEAITTLAGIGARTAGMLVDVAPAAHPDAHSNKNVVVAALADSSIVSAAIRPIIAAGIRVRSVVTPAAALASLARLRLDHSHRSAEAYVALGETATCIAIVRDGALVAARELDWGFRAAGVVPSWRREDIAERLAEELAAFFGALGSSIGAVTQVCICGGLLDLRTMTMPLMERLDVEVETLDALFGIDPERLPEPADEFRDRCAELRVAWAAAADWPSPIDLLRARARSRTRTLYVRAAAVAGIAIAPMVGWEIWGAPRTQAAPIASRSTAPRRTVAPRPAPTAIAPLSRPVTPPAPPIEPRRAVAAPTPPLEPLPTPRQSVAPPREPVAPRRIATQPVAPPQPVPRRGPPPVARASAQPPAETSIPFDAKLGSILFSPDRKLAIIDGRIVGIGDDVRGARVVAIGTSSVMLRDSLGRLRRLGVAAAYP